MELRVGCAGWSIPKTVAEHFPAEGSHLQRYAARLPAVEINTSFYKPHQPETYERWAASVPEHFRFSLKVPRTITHVLRLKGAAKPLTDFLSRVRRLGDKLGPLLVQLPPGQGFARSTVEPFFSMFREHYDGFIACEPRHASWFTPQAEAVLEQHRIARVVADPPRVPESMQPGGWRGLVYCRLHGSPRMYYSSYSDQTLDDLARQLLAAAQSAPVWCIFDNTALFAAPSNALDLLARLNSHL